MAAAATLVASAAVTGRRGPRLPAVLLLLGVGAAFLTTSDALSGRPLAGPLGYGNANGALAVVGIGASCVLAAATRGPARGVAVVLAALFEVVAWQTGSQAATAVGLVTALATCAAVLRPGFGRPAGWLALTTVAVALLSTVLLAVAADRSGHVVTSGVTQALSLRRVVLWSEALDLAREDPLTGVGLGRFAVTAPTARSDDDARWAHSLWLQQAAEGGAPALILLGGAAVVVLRPRMRAEHLATASAAAGVSVAALLVHASVDYVMHFPAVALGAAVLAGVALGEREGQRPATVR